jgi:glycerol-3-phosphate acyltransferase PlsY
MIRPDAQIRAGHIPAALLPEGTDPRTVVIVHTGPAPRRSYAGAIGVVLAVTVGIGTTIWIATAAVLQLASVAATTAATLQTVLPALVGGSGLVTLAVKIPRKAGKR